MLRALTIASKSPGPGLTILSTLARFPCVSDPERVALLLELYKFIFDHPYTSLVY